MIALSALSFTLRNFLDRAGFGVMQQSIGLTRGIGISRWQRVITALRDCSAVSDLTWRSEAMLRGQLESFWRFCPECGRATPHCGFDEFGAGWYAQICRCRYCGGEGMRVWPLAWW
jgi:hypothetical protein